METKIDTAKIIERYSALCAAKDELIKLLNMRVHLLEERCDIYEQFVDKMERSISKAEAILKEES